MVRGRQQTLCRLSKSVYDGLSSVAVYLHFRTNQSADEMISTLGVS